jgi:hypothetical protein
LCKSVPPEFAVPSPLPSCETIFIIIVFAEKKWPVEIKYVEKRIIVEDMD